MKQRMCERCFEEISPSMSMSIFNTQMCCSNCLDLERHHPLFKMAQERELEAIKKGDYNFQGIGLPQDYTEWANKQLNL